MQTVSFFLPLGLRIAISRYNQVVLFVASDNPICRDPDSLASKYNHAENFPFDLFNDATVRYTSLQADSSTTERATGIFFANECIMPISINFMNCILDYDVTNLLKCVCAYILFSSNKFSSCVRRHFK